MKTLSIDILCPTEYRDGICDSYESRVYYEGHAEDVNEAFNWAEKQLPKINALDECHGSLFFIYIEGHCVASIIKEKTIEKDEKALKLLNLYLTDEGKYFEALEKELSKYLK